MHNFVEYGGNYSTTSEGLWQCYRDEPNINIADSESFKSKIKITGNTPADCNTKDVELAVPLKCLSNFSRTLEIPLINCEISLFSKWLSTCVIINSTVAIWVVITDTKLYVSVVTLSIQDKAKLLQQ